MLSWLDGSDLAGFIAGALERSTVDLADQFSRMIITQRAYSSNAQVLRTADEMTQAVVELVGQMISANGLAHEDIVSILFTATPDLHAAFPASAARELGLADVPLICAQELDVTGAMPRVVRVMAVGGVRETLHVVAGAGHGHREQHLAPGEAVDDVMLDGVERGLRHHGFLGDAAPGDVARVNRRDVWQELLAHRRENAICGDEEVGAFARAIGEYGSVIFIAGNLPMKSEIVPLLIIIKLEQFNYSGATAIGTLMLALSFVLLLVINLLQAWARRGHGA